MTWIFKTMIHRFMPSLSAIFVASLKKKVLNF